MPISIKILLFSILEIVSYILQIIFIIAFVVVAFLLLKRGKKEAEINLWTIAKDLLAAFLVLFMFLYITSFQTYWYYLVLSGLAGLVLGWFWSSTFKIQNVAGKVIFFNHRAYAIFWIVAVFITEVLFCYFSNLVMVSVASVTFGFGTLLGINLINAKRYFKLKKVVN